MYWVLATFCILVALVVPRLRPLGIAGCVVLGLMLIWGVIERLRTTDPSVDASRGRPTSPTAAIVVFPLENLASSGLRIEGRGAPYELQGHIRNRSENMRLRSVTADIARRDCYEGALDPSGCVLLWQSRTRVELGLAPGEEREFSTAFWTRGEVPRARGETRDEIAIVAADGVPLVTDEVPAAAVEP